MTKHFHKKSVSLCVLLVSAFHFPVNKSNLSLAVAPRRSELPRNRWGWNSDEQTFGTAPSWTTPSWTAPSWTNGGLCVANLTTCSNKCIKVAWSKFKE